MKSVLRASWINVFSLDAVAVGVVWQCVFTREFCGRWPHAYESMILGLSIWLAYTADRLLDSRRLDPSRPHTLRHGMHDRHFAGFCLVWLVVLTFDTALIVWQATEPQLRIGFIAIGLVLAYIASVHCRGCDSNEKQRPRIPKELKVGMIFAVGVSMNGWAHVSADSWKPLAIASVISGLLFTLNCITVASWESESDHQQGFTSLITRHPKVSTWVGIGVVLHTGITIWLGFTEVLPLLIAVCLSVSSGSLLVTIIHFRRIARVSSRVLNRSRTASVDLASWSHETSAWPTAPRAWLADASIAVPPSAWMLFGMVA